MPLNKVKTLDNRGRAKAYLAENKIGFIPAYHVMRSAFLADGVPMVGEHPGVPAEAELPAEDKSAISAARSALGIEG